MSVRDSASAVNGGKAARKGKVRSAKIQKPFLELFDVPPELALEASGLGAKANRPPNGKKKAPVEPQKRRETSGTRASKPEPTSMARLPHMLTTAPARSGLKQLDEVDDDEVEHDDDEGDDDDDYVEAEYDDDELEEDEDVLKQPAKLPPMLTHAPSKSDLKRKDKHYEEGDEDEDDDELVPSQAKKVHPLNRSIFQHGFNQEPILYKVPQWAAIVPDGVDRAVLGTLDFMLGLHKSGRRLNARGMYLRVDAAGNHWYVVTREQLRRWIAASSDKQIRNSIDRLAARGLVIRETQMRGKERVAMRLRLNWPAIAAAFAALVPLDEEDE